MIGLAWGALMLVLLGFWMRSTNEPSLNVMVTVFLVAGGISAGLAVWQAFALWFKQESADQKTASLDSQRRILGNILLVAGLALIGASFHLGVSKTGLVIRLAESIGVLLSATLTSVTLTLPVNASDESSMPPRRRRRCPLIQSSSAPRPHASSPSSTPIASATPTSTCLKRAA